MVATSVSLPIQCDALTYSTKQEGRLAVGISAFSTAIWDGGVALIDTKNKTAEPNIIPVSSGVTDVAFVGEKDEYFVASVDDGTLEIYSKNSIVRGLAEHHNIASSVSAHPTERKIFISASWDLTLKIWDVSATNSLATFQGHSKQINKVEWNRKAADLFATTSDDKTTAVWDRRLGNKNNGVVHAIPSPVYATYGLSWSKFSEHILAVGEADGTFKVYDLRSLEKPTFSYKAEHRFNRAVRGLQFSPHEENLLAVGTDAKTVAVWDIKANKQVYENTEHTDYVRAVAWDPFTKGAFASGSWDKTVKFHTI